MNTPRRDDRLEIPLHGRGRRDGPAQVPKVLEVNRAEFPGAVQSMSHSWSGMTSHSNTLWRRPGSAPVAMDYLDSSSRRYRSAGLRPNAKATCSTKAGRPRRRAYQASSRGNAVGAGLSGGEPVQPVERLQVPVAVDGDEPRADERRVRPEARLDSGSMRVHRDYRDGGREMRILFSRTVTTARVSNALRCRSSTSVIKAMR